MNIFYKWTEHFPHPVYRFPWSWINSTFFFSVQNLFSFTCGESKYRICVKQRLTRKLVFSRLPNNLQRVDEWVTEQNMETKKERKLNYAMG